MIISITSITEISLKMAITISVKPTWKGTYGGTKHVVNDVVSYNGSSHSFVY